VIQAKNIATGGTETGGTSMADRAKIVTGIGKAELHRILVRGYDLNKELVGKISVTDPRRR
jgi:hypothetical protein